MHPSSSLYPPIPDVSILGICGASRHGKDSLALALMRLVPGAERFALSDAISAVARAIHGMGTRDTALLQRVGYDARQKDAQVWLRCLYGAISDRRPSLAIVTGVRFRDEAAMIREMGGQIVRVLRVEPDGKLYRTADRDPEHPVEREIDALEHDAVVSAPSGDLSPLHRFATVLVNGELPL